MTFGIWLRTRRNLSGLSLKALGDKVGVTHSHLSNIENGKSEPHKDLVVALADALGVERRTALRAFIGDWEAIDQPPEIEYAVDLSDVSMEGMNDYSDIPSDIRRSAQKAAGKAARETFMSVVDAIREARADDPGLIPGAGPVKADDVKTDEK